MRVVGLSVTFPPARRPSFLLLVALVAVIGATIWRIAPSQDIHAGVVRASAAAEQRLATPPAIQAPGPERSLAAPWGRLFDAIEFGPDPGKVTLLRLDADADTGVVSLDAEGRDAAAITDYIAQLHARGVRVEAQRSALSDVTADSQRIRSSLTARWAPHRPATAATKAVPDDRMSTVALAALSAELFDRAADSLVRMQSLEVSGPQASDEPATAELIAVAQGTYEGVRQLINGTVAAQSSVTLSRLVLQPSTATRSGLSGLLEAHIEFRVSREGLR